MSADIFEYEWTESMNSSGRRCPQKNFNTITPSRGDHPLVKSIFAKGAVVLLTLLLVAVFVFQLSYPALAQSNESQLPGRDELLTGFIGYTPFEFDASSLNSRTACLSVYQNDSFTDLLYFRQDEIIYTASLTKIMTGYTAHELLERSGTNLDDYATVRPIDLKILDQLNASVAGFQAGESVRFRDLFYGLLLSSGADAANALARETAGSITDFVSLMNESAQTLNLTNTHFANTTGLFHVDNYGTAKDMVTLLHAAWEKPLLREAMATRYYTSPATSVHPQGISMVHSISLYSSNAEIDSKVIDGGKTGQIKEAGYCLASFKEVDDSVFFLCTTGAIEGDGHLTDHIAIYNALLKQLPASGDYMFTAVGAPAPTQPPSPIEPSEENTGDVSSSRSLGLTLTVIAAVILGVVLILTFALVLSMLIKQRMEKGNDK